MKIKYNRFGKITKIVFDKNETPFLLSENFKSAEGGNIPLNKITAMMIKQRAKLKRNKHKKIDTHRINTLIDLDVMSIYGINKSECYSFILKKS